MAKRKLPLYLCIVEGTIVRCLKDGVVNWPNTQWYTISDIEMIANEAGRPVHILKYQGDANLRGQQSMKTQVVQGAQNRRWYRIESTFNVTQ
jgi:hypothetical protein